MIINRRNLMIGAGAGIAGLALPRSLYAADGKILVVATTAIVNSFDPHIGGDLQTSMLMRNVYDGLVSAEGNPPKPAPRLATSWTVSPDGSEYTFKLDPAAKFHDGTPVDAAAVKYSFDRIRRLGLGNSWMIRGIVDDNSITIPDAGTIKIKLIKPFSALLAVLPWISIVNPKLIEANKGSDDAKTYLLNNAVGSGPFKLKSFAPGDYYEFERVADGWRKGGGNLTGTYWKIVRETATQRLMIDRGDAHFAIDLNSGDMDSLKGNTAVKLIMESDYQTFFMRMNTQNGPMKDVHFRRAVSYAMNYKGMLDVAGYADLLQGPVPTNMPGHDKDLKVYRTDLEMAKKELAMSATPTGAKISAMHSATLEPPRRFASILLDSLRPLNIEVELKPVRFADGLAAIKTPQTGPDVYCIYELSSYADPDNVFFGQFHSSLNGGWQNPYYNSPKVDELAAKARSEPEGPSRQAMYKELQKTVIDDAPDIFGVVEKRKLALRTTVSGYTFTPVFAQAIDFFPLSI